MKPIRNSIRCGLSALALTCVVGGIVTGCGGGSGSVASSRKVTAQTRTRVAAINTQFVRALAQSGVQTSALAAQRNGSYSAGTFPAPPAGFGGTGFSGVAGYNATVGAPTQYIPPMPMLGAFIHSLVTQNQAGRSVAVANKGASRETAKLITRGAPPATGGVTGSGASGGAPIVPPAPLTFYYDNFLGLWVDVQNTATQSTDTLYVDQAKTQPAGSIVTTFPTGSTYPQVYSSTYQLTAGLFAGSHGSYQTTINQDGSGTSTYSDTYADSSTDSGTSTWTAQGANSWSDESTDASGGVTTSTGSFKADGSGTTHATTADGYTLDYTYNADGSGSGKISGPAAGLPATVTWDIYGDTTITYADGTVDYIPGWSVPPATITNPGSSTSPPATSTTSTPPAPPSTSTGGTPPGH
jgi:hypothetical protein